MDWADLRATAFDFETTGTLPEFALQPWRIHQRESDGLTRFSLTSLAIYPDYANVTGLYPSKSYCEAFLLEAQQEKRWIVGWNVVFDIQCLLALGLEAEVMACRWLDGMLLWKHAVVEPEYEMTRNQKQHFKLKGPGGVVALLWPGEENYGEGIDFHDPTPAKRAELQAYNERDTRYTYDAAQHWWERLTERQQMLALTEAESLPLVAAANLRGLPVDTLACHELQAMLHAQAAAKLAILGPLGVTEKVVRSPKQLQKVLFVDWKYPVLKVNTSKKTGNESNSTDKEVLHELALDGYENAKHIHEYRQALNRCTKFVDNPLASVDYNADGRTHPQAFVFSTYTGRMTYASTQGKNKDERQIGYAIHQEKRDKIFRAKIVAPPGYQLMEFDASGQEFRWFAVKSRDPTMLKLCLPGEKPHAFMGARIFEMDYQEVMKRHAAGEERFAGPTGVYMLGKVSNLCLAEGTLVLTDRGYCAIQDVRLGDKLWDGIEWVNHGGVVFQGQKETICYAGIRATHSHRVLVSGHWETLEDAARHGWTIESSLGTEWSRRYWSVFRIVGGCIRRVFIEMVGSICEGHMSRVQPDARSQFAYAGSGPLKAVQVLHHARSSRSRRTSHMQNTTRSSHSETCEWVVSTVQQSERQKLSQLRRSWDRMSVLFGEGGRRICAFASSSRDVLETRYRSYRQRWRLHSRKFKACDPRSKYAQPQTCSVYDILDAGPRLRFVAAGLIVHNSLQYRTSAKRLRVTARTDYDIPMTEDEAKRNWAIYRQTYPGAKTYWAEQIDLAKRQGYVETLAGRRVKIIGDWNGSLGWSMESTAINFPVQGTGGDQKYLALATIKPYLRANGIQFVLDMHDGLYFFVPDALVGEAATEIKAMLDNLPYKQAWGVDLHIPMPWDCKVGRSWGQLAEWKS